MVCIRFCSVFCTDGYDSSSTEGGVNMGKCYNFFKNKVHRIDWYIWGVVLFGSIFLGVFGNATLGISWFIMMAIAKAYIFR